MTHCSLCIIINTNASQINHYVSYRGCLLNIASVFQEYLYIFQSFNSSLKTLGGGGSRSQSTSSISESGLSPVWRNFLTSLASQLCVQTIGYSASRSSANQSEPWRHSQLQISTQLSSTRSLCPAHCPLARKQLSLYCITAFNPKCPLSGNQRVRQSGVFFCTIIQGNQSVHGAVSTITCESAIQSVR